MVDVIWMVLRDEREVAVLRMSSSYNHELMAGIVESCVQGLGPAEALRVEKLMNVKSVNAYIGEVWIYQKKSVGTPLLSVSVTNIGDLRTRQPVEAIGHPRQTSRREDHHIVRNARMQTTTSSAAIQAQVAPSLGAPVSSRTIRRRLAEGHLGSRRPLSVLPLTPTHRRLRLEWCRARGNWTAVEWNQVVFSGIQILSQQ
ncbi:transposable element Tcb2 transposase [Trichonephila clavipes]|uniref:Transposable element Tcb2 transposase n=1 Tax=Trichonephila clavipes TaxID=2585209 RepID=A0A8X6VCL7_TRICX|nr:transposable element Tcb2 transposase [Trichonephila clavipes]